MKEDADRADERGYKKKIRVHPLNPRAKHLRSILKSAFILKILKICVPLLNSYPSIFSVFWGGLTNFPNDTGVFHFSRSDSHGAHSFG